MLRYASHLSDNNEYALVFVGQSLGTPNGNINDVGDIEDALITRSAGADISVAATTATVAGTETIICSAISASVYAGATIRMGSTTYPRKGVGTIVSNTSNTITVTWTTAPGALGIGGGEQAAGTYAATICYPDGRHSKYDNVRVLQAFLPNEVGAYPTAASPIASPGPGYTINAAVDDYSKLGLFLPFTFVEGIAGFGVYAAANTPTANTIDVVAGFATSIMDSAVLRVEAYDAGGVLTDTHTASVASHADKAATTFTTVNTDITTGDDTFAEVAHGLVTGQMVFVTSSGAFPTSTPAIDANTPLWVIEGADADHFKVASTYANAIAGTAIDLTVQDGDTITWHVETTLTVSAWSGGTPSGATTYKVEVWQPHWFDNPHALASGPGFLHPTNHSEPLNANVANRPRGNPSYGWGTKWGVILSLAWRLSQSIGKRINVIYLTVDASYMISNVGTYFNRTYGWVNPAMPLSWNPQTSGGLANRLETLLTNAEYANDADGNTKPLKVLAIYNMQGEAEATSVVGREMYADVQAIFYNWLQDKIHSLSLNYWDKAREIPIVQPNISKNPWELEAGGGDTGRAVNIAISAMAAKRPYARTFTYDDQNLGDGLHLDGPGEAAVGSRAADALITAIDEHLSLEYEPTDAIIIEICNMALSYVGEKPITSLAGSSSQSILCNRFFEPTRDQLQQRVAWAFNTRRGELERCEDVESSEWPYAYGMPDNCIKLFSVLPADCGDDYSISIQSAGVIRTSSGYVREESASGYTEQPFTVELGSDGYQVILAKIPDAVGRWSVLVADSSLWPSQYRNAMAYKLAVALAGAVMKGEEGAQFSQRMTQLMEFELAHAKIADGFQHDPKPKHSVPWISARRSSARRW